MFQNVACTGVTGRRRRRTAAEAEDAGVVPDAREIRLTVGGARCGCVQVRLAVGVARHVLRRIRRPLRVTPAPAIQESSRDAAA